MQAIIDSTTRQIIQYGNSVSPAIGQEAATISNAIVASIIANSGSTLSLSSDGTTVIVAPPTFAQIQSAQSALINSAYANALASGIVVSGLTLPADDLSISTMTSGVTACTAGLLVGLFASSDMLSAKMGRGVTDISGESHDMTIGAFIAMALAYGSQIGALQGKRDTLLGQIAAAQDVATVQAVNWS